MIKKLDKIIKAVAQVVKNTDSVLKVFALVIVLIAIVVYVCLFKEEISDKQLAIVMTGFVIIVILCLLVTYLAAKKNYILHMTNKILQGIINSEHGPMDLVTDDIRGVKKETGKKKMKLKLKKGGEKIKNRNNQIQLPFFSKKGKNADSK